MVLYIQKCEKSFLHKYLWVHVQYWLFLGVIEGSIFQKLSVQIFGLQICRFVFRYLNCRHLSPKKHKGQVKIICWYFWHIYILASPNILPLNAIMSPTQWKAGDLLKTTMTSIDCIWSSLMDVLPIHSRRFGPSCWFCQCFRDPKCYVWPTGLLFSFLNWDRKFEENDQLVKNGRANR